MADVLGLVLFLQLKTRNLMQELDGGVQASPPTI
jgi:hypothetical protein